MSSFHILINPKILRQVSAQGSVEMPTSYCDPRLHETFPRPDTGAYPVSLFDDGGFH